MEKAASPGPVGKSSSLVRDQQPIWVCYSTFYGRVSCFCYLDLEKKQKLEGDSPKQNNGTNKKTERSRPGPPPLHNCFKHRHVPRLLGRPGAIAGDPHSAAGLSRSEVLDDDDDTGPALACLVCSSHPLSSLIQMSEPTRSQTGGERHG